MLQRKDDAKGAQDGCDGKHHLQKRPVPTVKVNFREKECGPAARRMSHPIHPDVHEPDPVQDQGDYETEVEESPDSAGVVIGEVRRDKLSDHTSADAEGGGEPDFDGVELGRGPRGGGVEQCDKGRELLA